MATYEIIVGNIGRVYHGTSMLAADAAYTTYMQQSCLGQGRAAGEPVTQLKDGEIVREWPGEQHD